VAIGGLTLQHPPLSLWTAGLALASITGLIVTTILVLWRHPEPIPTLLAFLRLPFYGVWRAVLLVGTVLTLRDKRWKRTSRKGAAA
jgi:hypothetical protein